MSAYKQLVQLDFIKDGGASEIGFGHIPIDDVKYPPLQTFNKFTSLKSTKATA